MMISGSTVRKAKGYTYEMVAVSRGDKLIEHNGVHYVIQHPKGKDNSQLSFPTNMPLNTAYYACRPHPMYYGLLPLTVPADIVTFPFQIGIYYGQIAECHQ
jgi:hypothetical protein